MSNDNAPFLLRSMLDDEATEVRASAAGSILELQPDDSGATRVLSQSLYSPAFWACRLAAYDLAEADPGNAVILLTALEADEPQTRAGAAHGLGEAMPKLKGRMCQQARRALAIAANDEDLAVRAEARGALRGFS